jgi:hypothetical protein
MKNILILLILITTTCFSQKHVVDNQKIWNIYNIPNIQQQ